jgi:hypothetical protein
MAALSQQSRSFAPDQNPCGSPGRFCAARWRATGGNRRCFTSTQLCSGISQRRFGPNQRWYDRNQRASSGNQYCFRPNQSHSGLNQSTFLPNQCCFPLNHGSFEPKQSFLGQTSPVLTGTRAFPTKTSAGFWRFTAPLGWRCRQPTGRQPRKALGFPLLQSRQTINRKRMHV